MSVLNPKLVLIFAASALALAGCGSKSLNHAPVEERMTRATNPSVPASAQPGASAPVAPVKQPQGFENAGKPGYYTVKPGDTMIRIALENGQSVQDIARWSQVDNPNRIEVGQVLRVVPPAGDVVIKPVTKPGVVAATAASAPASAASSVTPAKPAVAEGDINFIWPANGAVVAGFDEVKNKGLDIAGAAGDPVLAAADGRVVYVGAGLRGYGNLIILKHDNVFLTAYAHNQALLVKEDQSVLKGQKIAEMGNSDADRVKLHFEVRRQGKPVDPAKHLPAR
ncbi:MAG: lipoprotein NlpD [Comamonadaceae bacterium]|nr:MAG: lipoprotein NlpD [Comamonadaceae bacterium]